MFQTILKFFGIKPSKLRMAEQYDSICTAMERCVSLKCLAVCRKKIREFEKEWGDNALTSDLFDRFKGRVRLITVIRRQE